MGGCVLGLGRPMTGAFSVGFSIFGVAGASALGLGRPRLGTSSELGSPTLGSAYLVVWLSSLLFPSSLAFLPLFHLCK